MDAEDKTKIKTIIDEMVRVDKENVEDFNSASRFRPMGIEDHLRFIQCRASLAIDALARVGMVLAAASARVRKVFEGRRPSGSGLRRTRHDGPCFSMVAIPSPVGQIVGQG